MIPFRRPTIADYPLLQPYYLESSYRGADYSFPGIYLWGGQEFAIVQNRLVQFSHWHQRDAYTYPNETLLPELTELLIEDAHERGNPFQLNALTPPRVEQLEAAFPGRLRFTPYRDDFEYLYSVDRLADLRGRKMQSKRNHINRFAEACPDWTAVPLTPECAPACREMLDAWYHQHESLNPEEDYSEEAEAIRTTLREFDALHMEGLLLYSGGRIVAMTIGNLIRPDEFDVNFEKADPEIPGAYAAINREFARFLRERYPALQLINREEDMGIPGLRKAKESYHPDEMVEKYFATLTEESPV